MSVLPISFEAPIALPSMANFHPTNVYHRGKVVKKLRRDFGYAFIAAVKKPWPTPPFVVTFTRISPRELDPGDNISGAFKACRDELAALLGFNDRTPKVKWIYLQERRGQDKAIRCEIAAVDGSPLDT